jgi:hypothetical protein
MPGRIVVAFPLYRQLPVQWFFTYLNMEKDPIIGTVATEGIYLPMAMETMVVMAFEKFGTDWDRLVVWEHDNIPPVDAFNRIANYGEEHDIVGSVYFKHDWPHHIMAWMQVDKPRYSPLTADVVATMVDYPALYEVDGVAMGFTSIKREVFEQWPEGVSMWNPTPPLAGHDLHFCNEAKKAGFKVWLDSGIGCGHLTLVPIGYSHSQEALGLEEPQTWEQAMSARPDQTIKDIAQELDRPALLVTGDH